MNKREKKKILVYPCGTEIGLEIYKSVNYSTHFDLYGGSSDYGHGIFVYEKHLNNLPFITDKSGIEEIKQFNNAVSGYSFDYIYPAMDGVLYAFSRYTSVFSAKIIAPDFSTVKIIRSKKETYQYFKDLILVPRIFEDINIIKDFPIFIKPDIGQGSIGAKIIYNKKELEAQPLEGMLVMEYIPGEEYTVDCFTNNDGRLIYNIPRIRKNIKNGISVSAAAACDKNDEFKNMAETINRRLKQRGGWFFQIKRNNENKLVLLEIASRIAGASAFSRCRGINLPLLTLFMYDGSAINDVCENNYSLILDRALANKYAIDICYKTVYIDYDDTVIMNDAVNTEIISFLYQCVNNSIKIILLSKHDGDIYAELKKYRLNDLFDKVIHIGINEEKADYITDNDSIFIDDSFAERQKVYIKKNMPVFDTCMIECLTKPIKIV